MSKKLSYRECKSRVFADESVIESQWREAVHQLNRKIVVLDDDPTGTQTMHGIFVYTGWSLEQIRQGFARKEPVFFILTNSRGLSAKTVSEMYKTIAQRVHQVASECGKDFLIVCRGDSTLRGHYPLETEVIRSVLEEHGRKIDGEILCPFFDDGGRYTIGDIHYVKYGQELIPAGDTEFARDQTFGYRSSNLRQYVEEKTKGAYPASSVLSVSLAELERGDTSAIAETLKRMEGFQKLVVNACHPLHLKVFCTALCQAIRSGKHYLFRTAAPFINALSGIEKNPLLSQEDLKATSSKKGGLVIAGSHTRKTTSQLWQLADMENLVPMEMDSDLVLTVGLEQEAARLASKCSLLIQSGQTPVVYTKRTVLPAQGEQALQYAIQISDGVQQVVANLSLSPAFIIAKGGITSSDIATKALKIRQAEVLGQIEPGVPVWKTGPECLFPNIPYVIFPGNVGEEDTLKKAAEKLL